MPASIQVAKPEFKKRDIASFDTRAHDSRAYDPKYRVCLWQAISRSVRERSSRTFHRFLMVDHDGVGHCATVRRGRGLTYNDDTTFVILSKDSV